MRKSSSAQSYIIIYGRTMIWTQIGDSWYRYFEVLFHFAFQYLNSYNCKEVSFDLPAIPICSFLPQSSGLACPLFFHQPFFYKMPLLRAGKNLISWAVLLFFPYIHCSLYLRTIFIKTKVTLKKKKATNPLRSGFRKNLFEVLPFVTLCFHFVEESKNFNLAPLLWLSLNNYNNLILRVTFVGQYYKILSTFFQLIKNRHTFCSGVTILL